MRRLQFGLIVMACVASLAAAQKSQNAVPSGHVGRVMDWTSRQLVYSGGVSESDLKAGKLDVRILQRFALGTARNPENLPLGANPIQSAGSKKLDGSGGQVRRNVKIDWSVDLGAGVVAPNMFPAKFAFSTSGTPSCTNDFVVYGLNVGSSGAQANIVGINNLYSGTGGACGPNPTVRWAYRGGTGSILTSPVLSLDGTKIAYVESRNTSTRFHILTWRNGQGTVTAPTNPTAPPGCTAATNCLKTLVLSTTDTDTFSSPWIDYQTDKGFVASDDGKVYRISCVFTCALNSNPTIDWTFTLPVAGTGGADPMPTGPVYNFPNGLLFIADQLGEVWAIKANTGTPTLAAGPVMVGGGGCTVTNPPGRTGTPAPCTANGAAFGIPDSVILDARGGAGKIFAFSGNDGTANASATVVQMNQSLTDVIRVHVGFGRVDLHTGAFDNNYWGDTPTDGNLFLCGTGAADTTPYHYWIGFANWPEMDSTPTGSLQRLATANVGCSPYTEFYNQNLNLGGVAGHHDLLASSLIAAGANGYVITNDISSGNVTAALNFVNYPGGTSGIVVDNDSPQAQASSIYFTTQGSVNVGTCANHRCAVKLTQAALQ